MNTTVDRMKYLSKPMLLSITAESLIRIFYKTILINKGMQPKINISIKNC